MHTLPSPLNILQKMAALLSLCAALVVTAIPTGAHADDYSDVNRLVTARKLSEALAKVFEPYFSTKAIGTGLGLTIAKRNVEANGGATRVEFADDLPLFAQVMAEAAPSALEAALSDLNPDALTPKQALEALYRLKGLL